MSSTKYASPLHISISPSRHLFVVILAVHLGGSVLMVYSSLALGFKFLLAIATLVSAMLCLQRIGKVSCTPLVKWVPFYNQLIWDSDNTWWLMSRNEPAVQAVLQANSYVHPLLTVLNFQIPGRPFYARYRSIVLLADSCGSQTLRRLRVRLFLSTAQAQESESSQVLK